MNKADLPKGTTEVVKELMKKEQKAYNLRRMQVVYLGSQGISSGKVAEATQYSRGHIRKIWGEYREKGVEIFETQNGKPRNRSYLSFEEEKEFLNSFIEKSEQVGILIVSEIHKALEEKLGKRVTLQTTYNLLHRHG